MKYTDLVDYVVIGLGVSISLTDIQSLLSIILLIFNISWILLKFICRVFKLAKSSDFDSINDEVEHLKEDINEVINND